MAQAPNVLREAPEQGVIFQAPNVGSDTEYRPPTISRIHEGQISNEVPHPFLHQTAQCVGPQFHSSKFSKIKHPIEGLLRELPRVDGQSIVALYCRGN